MSLWLEERIKIRNIKKIKFIILITSFCILSYEIIFVSIFNYIQWHNLTSIIISLALFGFGVSGTVIRILKNKIDKSYEKYFNIAVCSFPVSFIISFMAYKAIPFNPFELLVNLRQPLFVFLKFIILSFPFLSGASIICLSFIKYQINKIYFYNLVGSGLAGIFIITFSYFCHPFKILFIIISLSFTIGFFINFKKKLAFLFFGAFSLIILISFGLTAEYFNLLKLSQYKSLAKTLNLPESKILSERYSPLGITQVVNAEGFRYTSGLSLITPFNIPEQLALFNNGEVISSITKYDKNNKNIRYLKYLSSAAGYEALKNKNSVLIIGSGGGEGILKSILYDFNKIEGLEINSNIVNLMKNRFTDYSGNIYNKNNVNIINKEARGYIKTTTKKYNLINMDQIDSYSTASSGIYALNESYLYTEEAIIDFYKKLLPSGILSITRWMVTPPRDNLKLFSIIHSALKKFDIKKPKNHIIVIRSLQTVTTLISKNGFSVQQINGIKSFCNKRLFDICFYPGINEKETNRFIKLKSPIFYTSIINIFSEKKKEYIQNYLFDIKTTTDNRPYYYNFFKPKSLDYILKNRSPITEWGYLLLVVFLIFITILSFVLILLPIYILKERLKKNKITIFMYFSLIAVGYFFVEMPLIQKLILFLSHPTYSLSIIISSLLISSGIGSYYSNKIFKRNKRIFVSVAIIIVLLLLYNFVLFQLIYDNFINYNILLKIFLTVGLIFPLGFFMGIPFPQGLQRIKENSGIHLPWAWGINGFFSVISILTASICSILFGFNTVFIIAGIMYLIAGLFSFKLQ